MGLLYHVTKVFWWFHWFETNRDL